MSTARGLLAGVLLVLCTNTPSGADDALIAEVIAGIDANLAMITHGRATYDVPRHLYTSRDGKPARLIVETMFLDDMTRWTCELEYCLRDQDYGYGWQPTVPGDPPFQTNIIKRPKQSHASPRPWNFHPRTLGHGVKDKYEVMFSLADHIRYLRQPPKNEWNEILAEREGDLIKVTVRIPRAKHPELKSPSLKDYKELYWVDPKQGYAIVHHQKWGRPEWPYHDAVTRYRQADNGAWIAEHYELHTRTGYYDDQNRFAGVRERHTVIELLDLDLTTPVDPEEFTLAAMGVPKGARIQDRAANREYFYQVPAVTEEEIEAEWERQREEHAAAIEAERQRQRRWTIYSIFGGIAAIVGLLIVYRWRTAWQAA